MPTAAPRQAGATSLQEIDERTQEAWSDYRESLRELAGREYDEAEDLAWEQLQEELRALDAQRVGLDALSAPGGPGT